MMKIALLTPTFCKFSGIDRCVEEDAKIYARNGDDVTIFTFESDITLFCAKIITLGMPKNITLQRIYRLFFFLDFNKIKEISEELSKFDVIISHFYPMNILASEAKKINNKIIWYYRDYGIPPICCFDSYIEKIYMILFKFLTLRSIKNCDGVISISKFLADEFYNATKKNADVFYIDIDKKRFNKNVKINQKIKEEYSFIKGPIVLYVGRLSPHKGIHTLIDAFKEVEEVYNNAYLIIIGKPTFSKYYKKLKQMAKGRNIIFTGEVNDEDLPSYYKLCTVYASCTKWEGYNMPLVEAQACGKPVIVYNIGPHSELVDKLKCNSLVNINSSFGPELQEIVIYYTEKGQ